MWTRINGRQLKFYRFVRSMTQDHLAARISTTKQHLGEVERGACNPSLDLLAKVCEVLDIGMSSLFVVHDAESIPSSGKGERKDKGSFLVGASGTLSINLPDGKAVWSRTMCRLLGIPPSRKPSLKLFLKRLCEKDAPAFAAFYQQLANGDTPRPMTCVLLRKDGKHRTLHVQADVLPGGTGAEKGQACALFMDVTESVAYHQHVLERQHTLQEIIEDKTRALAVAVDQAEKELRMRAEAEQEVRAKHAQLERLLAAVPAIIYTFVPGVGGMEWHSRHLQEILGYNLRKLQADPMLWHKSIHGDDLPSVQEAIDRAQRGEPIDVQYRIRTKSGEWRRLHDMAVPTKDAKGQTILSGVAVDVTANRQAVEDLARSRNMLAQAEVLAGMCSLEWDAGTDIWTTSDNWRRITGHDGGRMHSRGLFDLVHPDDVRRVMRAVVKTIRTGQPYDFQHRIIRGDTETVRHVHTHGLAERAPDGRIRRIYGTVIDVTDMIQTETALRHSEEMYRTVAEDTPVLICRYAPDCTINYVNKAYCDYFGKSPDDLRGTSFLELIPEADRASFVAGIKGLTVASPMITSEHRAVSAGGEIRWQCWTDRALFDAQGVIIAYQAIGEDITDRRLMEDALRESRQQLASVLATGQEMICRFLPDTTLTYVNPAYCRALGMEEQELLGRRFLEFVPEDIHQQALEKLAALDATNPTLNFTHEVIHQDGSRSWQEWTDHALFDADDNVVEFQSVGRDVTDRKRAEQALRESESRFRTLLQSMPSIAIQGYGPDGETRYWNKASERLYGYSEQEALGRNLLDLIIPPEMKDYVRKAISRMVETGQGIPAEEVWLMRKDGSRVPVHSSHVIVPVHGDDPVLYCIDFDLTEMKRAEVELRKVSEMLQTTSRMARIGGWGKNLLTGEDEWSEVTREIHEVGPDFVPDMHNSLAFYKEGPSRDAIIEAVTRLIETGEPYDVEVEFITAKGNELWVRTMGRAEFQDGRCVRIFGTFQDITDQKRVEEALRESQSMLSIVFDNAPVGIWVMDHEQENPLLINRYFRENTGFGTKSFSMTAQELAACKKSDDMVLMGHDPYYCEERVTFKDGRQHILQTIKTAYPGRGDRIKGVLGIGVDTTKRKQAEEMYQVLFREMLDGFALHEIICNDLGVPTDYRFLAVNPAFERATGLKHEDLIGKTVLEVLPETEDHWIRTYGHVALTGEPVVFDNFSVALQKHFVVTAFSPGPLQFACIFADITDRKMAEEKIRTINAQLQKAIAEKDKLFTIIAHDLKSPMSGLLTSTEFLAHQPDSFSEKDLRLLATALYKSTKHTFELLEDLLQWARMSQGGMDFAPTANSLAELVNMGLSTAQDLAERKDIAIRRDIPPRLTVLADLPMIKTVIRNILSNAIMFTPRGGEIVITARQSEQMVTVSVQDNGVGMSEQVLSSVFSLEKGKRHLGTEGEKGTGLGLMLCKQFIEQHGGHIWVQSEPGKGTTVFFTLPAQETRTPQTAEP